MAAITTHAPPLDERAAKLLPLIEAVEIQMGKLIWETASALDAVEPVAQRAAAYHLSSGGQRIRARLALNAGLSLGLTTGDLVSIATACELVHNASLVHDDLQDRDTSRHGKSTVWVVYGDAVAVCAGDLLLSAAYCALASISRPHLLTTLIPLLHRRITDASLGQCADLSPVNTTVFRLQDYERLAALKSGSLLALPLELSLAASGYLHAVPTARRAVESFAIAYQIADDLEDVHQDAARQTPQPAVNVVAILKAHHPCGGDAFVLAGQLALTHLAKAEELSKLLPSQSGQYLFQLVRTMHARIKKGCM